MDKGTKLVELLGTITAEDLPGLDTRIDALDRESAALKSLRQTIRLRLGLDGRQKAKETPRRSGEPKPTATNGTAGESVGERGTLARQRRTAIAKIMADEGPQRSSDLARRTNTPAGSITSVLSPEYFQQLADQRWTLKPEGRRLFLES